MIDWIEFELYLNFAIAILILTLLVILSYRNIKQKYILTYLFLTLFLALISLILYLLYLITLQQGLIIPIDLEYLSNVPFILVFFFLFLHFEALASVRPSFLRFSLILTLTTIVLTLIILRFFNLFSNLRLADFIITLFSIIFGLFSTIYPLKISLKSHRLAKELPTKIDLISIFIIFISNLLYTTELFSKIFQSEFLNNLNLIMLDLYSFLIVSSLTLLIINYLIHPRYIYRFPFPIHQIMLINKAGLLVYSCKVFNINIPGIDYTKNNIISGYINLIFNLMKVTFGANTRLDHLNIGNYQIFLSQIHEQSGILTLICSGGNYFLAKYLEGFTKSLPKSFLEKMNELTPQKSFIQEEFEALIKEAFPFLTIRDSIE